MINWNKLQPYKTNKQKSFEQLCYQIAVKLYTSEGVFTPIDDSGGGDGVEFYLTMASGEEWGWQAKYYEGDIRLRHKNRKPNIIDSLNRAIQVHPNLTIWYLCLPLDLTPDENIWLNTELVKHIPTGKRIKIIPWVETFIHEKINQPQFNGLKQSFFNDLELSNDWFKKAFDKSFSVVKNKFDEILYVPNEEFEYWYVNPLLCNSKFVEHRIEYYPRKLEELYLDAKEKLKTLNYTNDVWRPLFNEHIKRYYEFNHTIEILLPLFKQRLKNITPNNLFKLTEENYENEIAFFESIISELDEFRRKWKEDIIENTEDEKKSNLEQSQKIWAIESVYKEFIEEVKYYVGHSIIPFEMRLAHYLGNGGHGKTNLAVGITKGYLDDHFPAIYIPAIQFTGANPISEQILSILDIRTDYTFSDFLDCLDELGKIYNKRIPVVLDGLNEALNIQGVINERLSIDIPQLEAEFLSRSNLALLTTCRTSYKVAIWGNANHEDKRFHSLYGFTNHEDKKKLIRKYFSHYKVQTDLSFLSLERFTNPLYLKMFCESVNPEKKNIKQVTLGFDSIYSIFENFVRLCDSNVSKRIQRAGKIAPSASTKNLATTVLGRIAKHLWVNHQRAFQLDDLIKMADGKLTYDYKDSITKALLDEELLFIRNWSNKGENVYLTYDLMAGYFIAKYLVENISDFKKFFKSKEINFLIGDEYSTLHPNHEDIIAGLCSLLPIKKGIFIHDLVNKPNQKQTLLERKLFEKSIASTILLSPEYIPNEQIELIGRLAMQLKNMIYLVNLSEEVLFVSNHPFNFSFWSKILTELTMSDRDVSWTEHLRTFRDNFLDDLITEFELLQASPSLSHEQTEKIYLVSDFLKWTFTSTNKKLKAKSANALYKFSIKFPVFFFKEFYESFKINDPSIYEWMITVLYNTIIFILKNCKDDYESEIIKLSKFLSTEVLSRKGEYTTNNIVTRNYAFDILQLLVRKNKNVAKIIDLEKVKEEFKYCGVTKWKQVSDLNEGQYRDGNSLIDYYFEKEKMPYIASRLGSEYKRSPRYLEILAKLRWRAYQLGYQFELFGEIDIEIAKRKHWGDMFASTDRYADKYVEIAFLEYCGYLEAKNSLETYNDIGYLRTFKLKHDPTEINISDNNKLPTFRFVDKDYIHNAISSKKWFDDTSVPDMKDYLITDSFMEKKGNWVLLHSLVHQHKKSLERQMFFKVDTVLIKNKNIKAARKAFVKETKLGWAHNNIPYTQHIHESEIPDAESIPYNEFTKWQYSLSSKTVEREYTKKTLLKDGKKLNDKQADLLWDSILKELHFICSPRVHSSEYEMPMIRIQYEDDNQNESIEDVFKRMKIELVEEKFLKSELQKIEKEIEVFIPVRSHKNKIYLCKNIIDFLQLSSPYGSTDLFDQDQMLSSFNYTYEVEYVDQETFTYVRKDLLDKYLHENSLTMFQIIWGERDYYPKDGDWMSVANQAQKRKWTEFYEAIEYFPLK